MRRPLFTRAIDQCVSVEQTDEDLNLKVGDGPRPEAVKQSQAGPRCIAVLTVDPVDAASLTALSDALEAVGAKAALVRARLSTADGGRSEHQAAASVHGSVESLCFDGLIVCDFNVSRMQSMKISDFAEIIADTNHRRKPIIAIGRGGRALLSAAGVEPSVDPESRVWCANSLDVDFTLLISAFIHAKPKVEG